MVGAKVSPKGFSMFSTGRNWPCGGVDVLFGVSTLPINSKATQRPFCATSAIKSRIIAHRPPFRPRMKVVDQKRAKRMPIELRFLVHKTTELPRNSKKSHDSLQTNLLFKGGGASVLRLASQEELLLDAEELLRQEDNVRERRGLHQSISRGTSSRHPEELLRGHRYRFREKRREDT